MLLLRGDPIEYKDPLNTSMSHQVKAAYPLMTNERIQLARMIILQGARLDVVNCLGETPAVAMKAQRMNFDESVARWLATSGGSPSRSVCSAAARNSSAV